MLDRIRRGNIELTQLMTDDTSITSCCSRPYRVAFLNRIWVQTCQCSFHLDAQAASGGGEQAARHSLQICSFPSLQPV